VKAEWDLFWIAGGRVADWGALRDHLPALTEEAEKLASSPTKPPVVAPDEIHEVRIVSSWLAGDEAWECELEPGTDVAGWVEQVVAA
jgi:hypothetical protein